ncbi:MAG: hypothetical protein HC890_07155 [Chloroflexaceae bacterium]|nr:hypothetical protein [Chloroflexaceae bacterium]
MVFQHALLTRFNTDWFLSKSRSQQERNSAEFLEHRFRIFEKTCLPSVNAQSNLNFFWLLLLDAGLPEGFRERIAHYSSASRVKIHPVYIEDRSVFLPRLKQAIAAKIVPETRFLISTNLDSDDAIARNFIARVQEQFREQKLEFVNFLFGYLYRMQEQKLYLREWRTAPCYTLIESIDGFKTVLKYGHTSITRFNHCQIATEPLWLMTVHGQNVKTQFDVSAAWQPLNRLGDRFQVELDLPQKRAAQSLGEMWQEIGQVLTSPWPSDTPKVKTKKILNILSPPLLQLATGKRNRIFSRSQHLSLLPRVR